MNSYVENLVKAPYQKKSLLLSIGSIFLVPLLIFISTLVKFPFLITLSLFVPVLSYYIFQTGKIEYDYLYMGKELEITKVINSSRRKKLKTLSLEGATITSLSKIGQLEKQYRDYKIYNFTSSLEENKEMMFVITGLQNESKSAYLVELNQDMIALFKYDFGRNMEI